MLVLFFVSAFCQSISLSPTGHDTGPCTLNPCFSLSYALTQCGTSTCYISVASGSYHYQPNQYSCTVSTNVNISPQRNPSFYLANYTADNTFLTINTPYFQVSQQINLFVDSSAYGGPPLFKFLLPFTNSYNLFFVISGFVQDYAIEGSASISYLQITNSNFTSLVAPASVCSFSQLVISNSAFSGDAITGINNLPSATLNNVYVAPGHFLISTNESLSINTVSISFSSSLYRLFHFSKFQLNIFSLFASSEFRCYLCRQFRCCQIVCELFLWFSLHSFQSFCKRYHERN